MFTSLIKYLKLIFMLTLINSIDFIKSDEQTEQQPEIEIEIEIGIEQKNENVKQTFSTITNTIVNEVIPKIKAFSDDVDITKPYCDPELCEAYNGTHFLQQLHTACQNNGSFGLKCGESPHLLYMSKRRRDLILDVHNLARSRIAAGLVEGYPTASHMPLLKWDKELEYLATLHVKRCEFAHDICRNTKNYPYSGQNIGYFWIGREFKSHSRRMKSFIIDWFREYKDANQTFIDSYYLHPEGKKIGHFTMVVSDRAHRVGCAAIRFNDPSVPDFSKFLMTCNYDYNNILYEPIYQSGPTASKCKYRKSEKFPPLCDWKDAVYEYEKEKSVEEAINLNSDSEISAN